MKEDSQNEVKTAEDEGTGLSRRSLLKGAAALSAAAIGG
jgi:hypothetical protein